MAVTLHRLPIEFRESSSNCLNIGLVNNMPDAALRSTERQFLTLITSASANLTVRLSLFTLPEIPRTEAGRCYVNKFYSGTKDLFRSQLDGLIVTGTEPHAAKLTDEPYWGSLTKVMEWGDHNTRSTILSCLASHAALLHFNGIARRPLREKRFGLFEFSRVADHPLTAGTPPCFQVPQSRWNEISENELAACGYRILTRSDDAGVDMFVAQRKSLFVFFQGHPEYETNTLLLEYRRDVGRYLRHERDTYPSMPHGYIGTDTKHLLTSLRERAFTDRCEELLADFPTIVVESTLTNTWRSTAACIYRNWLMYLCAKKERGLRKQSAAQGIAPLADLG